MTTYLWCWVLWYLLMGVILAWRLEREMILLTAKTPPAITLTMVAIWPVFILVFLGMLSWNSVYRFYIWFFGVTK